MDFLSQTSLISYSENEFERTEVSDIKQLDFTSPRNAGVLWANTYGIAHKNEIKSVVRQNQMDDFLLKLMSDSDHPNKVINLENVFFLALKILKLSKKNSFETEQMFFLTGQSFLWSIQEHQGDYFESIRERLKNGTGIVRQKKADYLLFLIIECIIDNYQDTFEKYLSDNYMELNPLKIKPTPAFAAKIEARKQAFFQFKKAATSLRELLTKLEKSDTKGVRNKYFNELREQINYLIDDVDFELQQLESSINLIFSMQGHILNEVMKTLTIFSVIFIPLTFLAGIYGMNFEHIPELKFENGYYILLGIMALISLLSIIIIKRKRWF